MLFGCGICAAPAFAQQRGEPSDTSFKLADGTLIDDPAATFAVEVATILAGGPRVQALREFVDRWAATDPEAAARAVESLSKQQHDSYVLREGVGEITGRRWAERDPDGAIAWATRLGDLSVWSGVLVGLAAKDAKRAIAVASSIQTHGAGEMTNVVIAAIAAHDPAAAAEHWQEVGLAGTSSYAANHIARNWVARDQSAAEQWALGLPGGDGRDTALWTIVGYGATDFARAADLVNRIDDDRLRAMAAVGWLMKATARGDPNVADFEGRLVLSPAARALFDARLRP